MKKINITKFTLGVAILYDNQDGNPKVQKRTNEVLEAVLRRDRTCYDLEAGKLRRMTGPHTAKVLRTMYDHHLVEG